MFLYFTICENSKIDIDLIVRKNFRQRNLGKNAIKKTVHSIFDSDRISIGIILGLLGLWGCVAVYNAKIYEPYSFYFVIRQLLWVLLGITIYFISSKIPFKFYKKNALWFALLFWLPLMLVLVWGDNVNGMNGWFVFHYHSQPIYIQPAELAKPAYILCICYICYRNRPAFDKFILMLIICLLWIFPVVLEPDFGTAIIYFAGFIIVYWVGGGKKRYLTIILILGIISSIVVVLTKPYVLQRVLGFLFPSIDPYGAGWHTMQFRYSMARGGLEGAGLGKAIWSNAYLPLSHTDSIFSSLTETLGFIGVLPILIGFVLLVYLTFTLALRAKDSFVVLFSCSLVSLITFQAFLHIGVNVGLIPPTGVTLPLLSYGGSSLTSTMLGFGILISAAKSENLKK
jgi:cell division protein FtsW (lipid II flippase)